MILIVSKNTLPRPWGLEEAPKGEKTKVVSASMGKRKNKYRKPWMRDPEERKEHRRGRAKVCAVCGLEGGKRYNLGDSIIGTLLKVSEGKYRHRKCVF